jgi:hypothetical protein
LSLAVLAVQFEDCKPKLNLGFLSMKSVQRLTF